MSAIGPREAMANPLLAGFLAGEIDPGAFGHRQHVEVAYLLLREHDFLDAARRLADGLQALAIGAGVPEKFHLTVTLAFLSAIAERIAEDVDTGDGADACFEEFWCDHPELHDDRLLRVAYSPGRLAQESARTHFVLPDRLAADDELSRATAPFVGRDEP